MVQFCTCISVTPCIDKKLSPKWKNVQEQKVFLFYFTYCVKILVIKEIPKF